MASERRVEKVNNFLREELSKVIDREIDFPEGSMVTITRVETSENLLYGNIYISVLGGRKKEILAILEKNIYNIQQQLNRRLRTRPVPKIRFAIDEGELKREVVERSLAELKRKEDF